MVTKAALIAMLANIQDELNTANVRLGATEAELNIANAKLGAAEARLKDRRRLGEIQDQLDKKNTAELEFLRRFHANQKEMDRKREGRRRRKEAIRMQEGHQEKGAMRMQQDRHQEKGPIEIAIDCLETAIIKILKEE